MPKLSKAPLVGQKRPEDPPIFTIHIFQARHHHEFIDVHPREDIPQSHRQFILGHLQSASIGYGNRRTKRPSSIAQKCIKKLTVSPTDTGIQVPRHIKPMAGNFSPVNHIHVYLKQRRLTTSIFVQLSKFLHPRLIDVNWPIRTSMANELAKELRSSQSKILKIVELCETM